MEYGATIERGKIKEVRSGMYIVASLDRDGIETPPIPRMTSGVEPYHVGDKVYFFLFGDGEGMILRSL